MNLSIKTGIIAACIIASAGTQAIAKGSKKTKKENFRLLEAYTQRMLPGTPGAPPPTNDHFIIVWQGETNPEVFYWRGDRGFLICDMQKAHRISKKDAKKFPPGMDYNTEFVTGEQIHKGDTISLSPLTRGKFRIPDDIPKTAKNTLFYKNIIEEKYIKNKQSS